MSYISPNKNSIEELGDFITYNELPGKTAGDGASANGMSYPVAFVIINSDYPTVSNFNADEMLRVNGKPVEGFREIEGGIYQKVIDVLPGSLVEFIAPPTAKYDITVDGIFTNVELNDGSTLRVTPPIGAVAAYDDTLLISARYMSRVG